MSIIKKVISIVLCAIMVFSIIPICNIEAEAAVAYPKIEALKVPRIFQKSSEAELGMCHVNSYASIIAYKLGTYSFDGYKRTYSYGDYNYSNDPVWNKMLDVHYSYDPTGGASKYPVPITNRQVSGNSKETYEIIYEQLAMGKPVVIYSSTNAHASVVIGYMASTNSIDVSKFTVMEISDYWKNSKSIFDTYANSPMTSSSSSSCYMTLKAWLSRGGYKLKSVSYYSEPGVTINTSYDEYSVGETNAVLCGEVANPAGAKISKGGIKLYDASGKLLKNYSETFSHTYKKLDIWYNMKSELGYTLSSGTEYQYQLYAVVGGNTYTSRMGTFKTTGTASHILSVYYNANGGSISSDTYYLSSGNIYKSSDNSKHCQKWTYNNPQKDGLYNASTFGLTRNGYEFLGWSTTSSGEIWFDQDDTGLLPTHINPDIKNGDCSVTLYAVWKKVSSAYTLSYNANGGSGAPSSQNGLIKYTISSTVPVRSGYTFLGWSTSSNATSASYAGGDTISLSANTTLYAVWEEIPVYVAYELVYDANGGSGAPESLSFLENQTIYISEEIPTRFGYVFEGWVSQDGFWYYPGQEAMFFEATVLYASWGNQKLSADESIVLEITDECREVFVEFSPEESGVYAFKSFDTQDKLDTTGVLYDINGTELVSDDDNGDGNNFMFYYTVYAGETYYIKVSAFNSAEGTFGLEIVPAYYVTYNANGGQIILGGSGIEEVPDLSTTIPYIEVVREGYTFAGWSEDRTSQYAMYTEGDELYLDSNITLYAVWEKNDSPLNPEPDNDLDLPGFLTIRTPSVTTIKYGDSIVLHADLENVPLTGLKVTWEASNDNFEIVSVSEDGSECVITPKKSGNTTFTATVKIGTLAFSTDTQVMTSKAGFFQKIIAFFKRLFGITKTIPEAFKYAY